MGSKSIRLIFDEGATAEMVIIPRLLVSMYAQHQVYFLSTLIFLNAEAKSWANELDRTGRVHRKGVDKCMHKYVSYDMARTYKEPKV